MKLTPLILVAVLLAGCGSTSSSTSSSSGDASSAETTQAPTAPKTPKQQVVDCLKELYDVAPAGNATRVTSLGGNAVANVTFFRTHQQASAFDAQLLVPMHAVGKYAVAIYFATAKDEDKGVVGDCLNKG